MRTAHVERVLVLDHRVGYVAVAQVQGELGLNHTGEKDKPGAPPAAPLPGP